MKNKLIKDWNIATNKITSLFINKYFGDCEISWIKNFDFVEDGFEFQGSDGSEDGINLHGYWVGNDIGGILEISDYYFSFDRMKEALELNATEKQLFDYYDLELEEKIDINFKNYVKYFSGVNDGK